MAEEDIYGNKRRYERSLSNLAELATPPPAIRRLGQRRYFCRNPINIGYFERLHRHFESCDLSYARRNRYFDALRFITHWTNKDLSDCNRDDIDDIVAQSHRVNTSPESKLTFLRSIKRIWRLLFPEHDAQGRADETLTPYVVRHISCRIDKSREKRRNDRLLYKELLQLVTYFSSEPRMQAYITLAWESLGRPQELCYRTLGEVELQDRFGRVWVGSHGKEGVKFLKCIESLPYLMRWLEQHPFLGNKEAYLFSSSDRPDQPLTPENINKKLRIACKAVGIDKPITSYSLKRSAITWRRLRGTPDVEIQHDAGWTSLKQLSRYDLSTPEDSFHRELHRRGLLTEDDHEDGEPETRLCVCGQLVGFADRLCHHCKRPVGEVGAAKDDLRAENEMREVFAMAMQKPHRSFAEVVDEWRRFKVEGDSQVVSTKQSATECR